MYEHEGAIHIEKDDQCWMCQHQLTCPVMEGLALGVLLLDGEMTVQNCGFYKKKECHLKIV